MRSHITVQPLSNEQFRCRNPRVHDCLSKRIKILPREDIIQRYPNSITWVWSNYSISDRAKAIGGTAASGPNKYYLTILAMIKDDEASLSEWLEHHIAHGVEHFYLIDDKSTDKSRAVLDSYVQKGIVSFYDPPYQSQQYRQAAGFKNTMINIMSKNEARWIALLDVDEYLYSPSEFDLKVVLKKHEDLATIGLSWMWFGSSGHVQQPASIVQSFVNRANLTNYTTFFKISEAYKVLKHPSQKFIINTKFNVHNVDVHYVDVEGTEANLSDRMNTNSTAQELLLNHYAVQSKELYEKMLTKLTEHHKFHEKVRPNRDFLIVDMNDAVDRRLADQNAAKNVPVKGVGVIAHVAS